MQSTRRFQSFFLALFCTTGIGFHFWLESKLPPDVTTRVDLVSAGMVIFTLGWLAFGAEPAHTEEQVGYRWYVQYRTALWAGLVYYLSLVILTYQAPGEVRLILMAYGIFMTACFGFGTIVSPALGPRRIDRLIRIDKRFLPGLPTSGIVLSYVLGPDRTAVPAITCSVIATFCVYMMREFIQVRLNNHHGLFVAARAERDAQIASKQAFLAAAGHDFDQPLQAARLSFDQALRLDGADRTRAVERLDQAFDAMEAMVAQVSQHLKLEAGAVTAESRMVSLGQVMSHVASLNEPAAQAARVALHVLPSRLAVHGDLHLIERVLGNFVVNALRHAKPQRILIGARGTGSRVRLWVIDDGVGLAMAEPAALFEDYTRGDHGDEIRGGFGLGLASARRMATLMHGSVGQDPRWTKGAAFFLDLPAI